MGMLLFLLKNLILRYLYPHNTLPILLLSFPQPNQTYKNLSLGIKGMVNPPTAVTKN